MDSNDKFQSGDGFSFSGYDGDGNPGSYSGPSAFGTATYDEENRPTSITSSSTGTQSNVYDGGGKRVQSSGGSSTVSYVYDGSDLIEDVQSSGNVYHLPGVMDTIAGSGSSFTDTYFYANAQGSTLRTTSDAGNVTTSQTEYDAYGQPYNEVTGGATRYQFGGEHGYQTDTSGLVLCGARYYVPGIGRFLTQDPSGQSAGLNLYEYCGNNPVSNSDPTGLERVPLTKDTPGYAFIMANIAVITGTAGWESCGNGLSGKIGKGIYIETDQSILDKRHAAAYTSPNGEITIGQGVIDNYTLYSSKRDQEDIAYSNYWMQGILVHEYQHVLQFADAATMAKWSSPLKEIDACTVSIKYARQRQGMDKYPLQWMNVIHGAEKYRSDQQAKLSGGG